MIQELKQAYNRNNWLLWLQDIFGRQIAFEAQPEQIILQKDNAKSIERFASILLADGKNIAVLDIVTAKNVQIARNRVALRELVFRLIDHDRYHGILAFYHSEDAAQPEYRFSFISSEAIFDKNGNLLTQSTNPKRFTYVLGENESTRTASERLKIIAQKIGNITLDDVKEAFSVEPISDSFFNDYRSFYFRFIDAISKNNSNMDVFQSAENKELEISNFTKRLLGRIVFLYFLQKKRWIGASSTKYDDGQTDFLKDLFAGKYGAINQDNYYNEHLCRIFFEALNNANRKDDAFDLPNGFKLCLPYLNGGLFDESQEPKNHRSLLFPKDLFDSLFDFLNSYNFTIYENSPEDHTVAVDPEMLGHIFENLLEDNKNLGTFYTPKTIVQYMCQESLIGYLCTHLPKMPKENIGDLIRNSDADKFTDKDLKHIELLVDEVKICDPAIGSGAFPMGLLQEIFNLKAMIHYQLGYAVWSPATIKQNIIQNSIYGVDIEPGAIDIARLRFWLSLVVDESLPKPLPNLDYKIMQGNSLLESFDNINLSNVHNITRTTTIIEPARDLFGRIEDRQLKLTFNRVLRQNDIQKLMSRFFKETNPVTKTEIKNNINQTVHEHIDYNLELRQDAVTTQLADVENIKDPNPSVKKKIEKLQNELAQLIKTREKLHKLQGSMTKPYFLWHLFFADVFENGGFDIVIGNPPYIQLEKNGGELAKLYQSCEYKTFKGNGDIYCLFYERAWQLLRPQGKLCFITSNKWMRTGYGENTRRFFAENTNPEKLIDFAGVKVFESATVDTNILMFSKDKNRQQTEACVVKKDGIKDLSVFIRQSSVKCGFGTDSWVVLSPIEQRIKAKIEAVGTPLKDWDIQIYRGILTGYNEAFIIDGKKKDELIAEDPKSAEIIRPILRGRDIKRYGYEFADLWLINTHNGIKEKGIKPINIEDYPAIKKHLDKYYPKLEKRADKGDTPYNLRHCAYMEDFYTKLGLYMRNILYLCCKKKYDTFKH
jgi:methylase of polypeptide subunit release factors